MNLPDFLTKPSVWLYLFVFFGKIIEVAVATIRIVLINRGERVKGSITGFFEVSLWLGFFAPRGTPAGIVNRLHAELVKIVLSPDMKEQLERNGAEPAHNASNIELERLVRSEIDKYAKVLKAANIKLE